MLPFGKYQGLSIRDIYYKDKSYIEWLLDQPWFQVKYKQLHDLVSKEFKLVKPVILQDSNTFLIYTDGACKNNGSVKKNKKIKAGIGVHYPLSNKYKLQDISMRLDIDNPTNNRAELIAIQKAIESCIENNIKDQIIIYTDSDYSMKCINVWYDQWVKQDLLQGKKNIDLIKSIYDSSKSLQIILKHVKAHTKNNDIHSLGNKEADRLATICL